MAAVTPIDPDLKDRVLSDIAGGMRPKAAAEKYGVKPGTIGQWCARAGLTLGVRKKAEKVAVKVKGGKVEKAPEPAPSPARAPGPGNVRPSNKTPPGGILAVEKMAPELREKLRQGAWGLADTLAEVALNREAIREARAAQAAMVAAGATMAEARATHPIPSPIDMRQIDAAARALKSTLEIAPGLASFDQATGGADNDATVSANELAAMDALIVPEPPSLVVVEGGRATGAP